MIALARRRLVNEVRWTNIRRHQNDEFALGRHLSHSQPLPPAQIQSFGLRAQNDGETNVA